MIAVFAGCLAHIPIEGASAPDAIKFTLPVARAHRDKHSASPLSGVNIGETPFFGSELRRKLATLGYRSKSLCGHRIRTSELCMLSTGFQLLSLTVCRCHLSKRHFHAAPRTLRQASITCKFSSSVSFQAVGEPTPYAFPTYPKSPPFPTFPSSPLPLHLVHLVHLSHLSPNFLRLQPFELLYPCLTESLSILAFSLTNTRTEPSKPQKILGYRKDKG